MVDRVGGVDQVGIEERVDRLRKRSIKRESKLWALDLAIRMIDLTTLEGKDTQGKVRRCAPRAYRPTRRTRPFPASRQSVSTPPSSAWPVTRCVGPA
jgi:hypothetical protein